MSERRRPWTCLEFVHQCKRQKQRYIVSYRLVACCGYSAVTTDRVTGRAELSAAVRFPASLKGISSGSRGDGIVKWEIQGCDLYSRDVQNVATDWLCSIQKCVWSEMQVSLGILRVMRWTLSFPHTDIWVGGPQLPAWTRLGGLTQLRSNCCCRLDRLLRFAVAAAELQATD